MTIANLSLGRSEPGKDAIALLYVDGPVEPTVIEKLKATGLFRNVSPLEFNVS